MKKEHSYEYLGSTSYTLILWAFGLTFGLNIVWSRGLVIMLSIFRIPSEEEHEKAVEEFGRLA